MASDEQRSPDEVLAEMKRTSDLVARNFDRYRKEMGRYLLGDREALSEDQISKILGNLSDSLILAQLVHEYDRSLNPAE